MADWTVFLQILQLPIIITSPLWFLSISVHKTFAIQQQQRNKDRLNWFIVKNWTHYYRYCYYIYRTSTDPSHYIVDIPPYSHAWNIDMSFHITLHSTCITNITSCSFSFPVLPVIDPFIGRRMYFAPRLHFHRILFVFHRLSFHRLTVSSSKFFLVSLELHVTSLSSARSKFWTM